jgi:hypothetical protein
MIDCNLRNRPLLVFIVLFVICLFSSLNAAGDDFRPGLMELYRLDWLPRLKQSIEIGCVSSYDRSGGNDDGFSGKFSFIRKGTAGLVLADLKGPGCIYRIWTPTPTDDPMEFYFDGEKTPRIQMPFRHLFTGDHAPFLSPIAGSGAGGFVSYFPLPFKKSCKVVMKAEKVQFYQINYALYPEKLKIETYRPVLQADEEAQMDRARSLWNSAGGDISRFCASPGDSLRILKSQKTLAPGGTAVMFEIARPGRIAGLRLKPADALAGKKRDILIRMFWDGEERPAVSCPAGDFFGASWGEPAVRSLMLGAAANTDYMYFPMPFDRSARIELVSEAADGDAVEVQAELVLSDRPRTQEEGRFYAVWRRENPTQAGTPFTFLDIRGRGHVAGCILQAQGLEPGSTPFFEGDDQTWIDGKLAVNGTGSEDFFNGGWYDVPDRWEERKSFPLSGCLDYKKYLGRSAGYRMLLTDAYAFRKSILQTIEHGPENNAVPADYCATTFFYTAAEGPEPSPAPTPTAERKVVDLRRIKFTPGWNVPIQAFSFQNVTLTKKTERIGGTEVRFLSMCSDGEDIFGRPFVSFAFDIPEAGRYAVGLEALLGPAQGTVQMFRNENPAGAAADLFSEVRRKSDALPLGVLAMRSGINVLYFKVVGRNPRANGSGFDPVTFIFDRMD